MASDRFRRPDPARTGPIRDVSELFRSGRGWPLPWSPEAWGIPRSWTPWIPPSGARGSDWRPWWTAFPEDAAAHGVRTGYQVAAEEFDRGVDAGTDDRTSGPPPAGIAGLEDVQNLTLRMWRYAADLMWQWSDLMSGLAQGRMQAPTPTPHQAARASHDAAAPRIAHDGPTAVELEVASRAPVRVQLWIDPHTAGDLLVQKLRDPEERFEPIAGAQVVLAPGAATLRLHVPDDQPAGRYSGSVLSAATHTSTGHLTVDVLEPPAAR